MLSSDWQVLSRDLVKSGDEKAYNVLSYVKDNKSGWSAKMAGSLTSFGRILAHAKNFSKRPFPFERLLWQERVVQSSNI